MLYDTGNMDGVPKRQSSIGATEYGHSLAARTYPLDLERGMSAHKSHPLRLHPADTRAS